MEKKYYLHRISHEANISYDLLDKGFLSLGWSRFSKTDVLASARENGYPRFGSICEACDAGHDRSRWSMWYFAQMNPGDIVVVPQYGGLFSVYEVIEQAKSICEYDNQIADISGKWDKIHIIWKEKCLFDSDSGRMIDIGFLMPVKEIVKDVKRDDFTLSALYSRMKIRQTNSDISDIHDTVEQAIRAALDNKPVSLYGTAISGLAENLKSSITSTLNDSRFEKLIRWYMKKCGATSVMIPAKNAPDKKDGADADIIAEFGNLKHRIYIQAKKHDGVSGAHAVEQITRYTEQKESNDGDFEYTYASWVISSADDFSYDAKAEAATNGVRLIDGTEFSRMLIDKGLTDIDRAFWE